ncbi:NgoFVII family restriction endonuclease [Oceanispirochaeta crateris]|uniref:NgoFVII family restriction endonuclease n=1 Tax=Oceanispirochaeta crateris TaxID=2518645 RepID=A0A5C1QMF3_9SPIO|nr:restriction endonuclease PLD domain-containing protein [Oceanispirochaeta crateris]QEN07332.1 NgoFVII family restriction endonuclease [Oceanispirochaeta crateris]
MFFLDQNSTKKDNYMMYLILAGSLSNLFSDSDVPYLNYRLAEKVFCKAFSADDLSRNDIAVDSIKNGIGFGLKTFLRGNDKTLQKVAEFNQDRPEYITRPLHDQIIKIAELRNRRLKFAQDTFNIDSLLYHCVLRSNKEFHIFEENMDYIDIENISSIKKIKNTIRFKDSLHEYSFSLSKSTLLKRFQTSTCTTSFPIDIIDNPLEMLLDLLPSKNTELMFAAEHIHEEYMIERSVVIGSVYLPLYGIEKGIKKVFERSGLNQWNARGRDRHENELYIPVPRLIHQTFPGFFPPRDTTFNLKWPTGETIIAKICQQGGKALMSQSNRDLGEWILRRGLNLNPGELATYELLKDVGIDSVRIDKYSDNDFGIYFTGIDSYEKFKKQFV